MTPYEQGYNAGLEKLGISLQAVARVIAKRTPWGLFKSPLSPEAVSKGLQFAETGMRARAPRAVEKLIKATGVPKQPVSTLNPEYVRAVRQGMKEMPGFTQRVEAMGGRFLGVR